MTHTASLLKAYTDSPLFDPGKGTCKTVLEQLYQAYRETCDFDTPEIKNGFEALDQFMEGVSLAENNNGFEIVCDLCFAYERRAFMDGVQYGAHLMRELYQNGTGAAIDTPGAVV